MAKGVGGGGGRSGRRRLGGARRFEGPTEQTPYDWGQEQYTEWWDGLSSAERDAFSYYVGPGYGGVNGVLRGKYESDPYTQAHINNLSSALGKSPPLQEDVLAYRVFGSTVSGQIANMEPGRTFVDNGFASTSLRTSGVSTFESGGKQRVQVLIPKGSRGAYISRWDGEPPGIAGEYEFLLPAGTKFRVIDNGRAGSLQIVEVVP